MVYADYEYYTKKYFGTLPEDSFNSLVLKASSEIDENINTDLTQDKINNLSSKSQEKLKHTTCVLIDLISKKQESENKKLKSYSIDGIDKTFNIMSNEDYKISQKDILKKLPDELTCYI